MLPDQVNVKLNPVEREIVIHKWGGGGVGTGGGRRQSDPMTVYIDYSQVAEMPTQKD